MRDRGVCVRRSHIEVDEYQNTSVDGVFAVGDVCGQVELTPVRVPAVYLCTGLS